MPLISVVVPVYAVAGYLRECLDSILGQSFTDIEVIAVDDQSPDHCPAILDEYASVDPRVRVVHLAENVGLGPARNAGLDLAQGEYVWFVDSDDRVTAGALGAIADRLGQTRPDVLLVDHERVSWVGTRYPSAGRDLLRALQAHQHVPLAHAPGLLALFTVAWNKVVRREFLLGTGVRFDRGWYEDLPFTYPVLVAAERIATLGRVCYHYRRRRTDAITQTRSVRHFEVFDQWTRVFDRLDHLGQRSLPYRTHIFERMLWHLLVVLSVADRLPPRTRRAFFHRISQHYHRYRPAGANQARAGWVDRLRRRLIAADAFRWYRALRLARIAGRTVRRRARAGKRRVRSTVRRARANARAVIGRSYYHLHRRRPLDDRLALYAAYWYRGYSCNPAAIYTKARELAPGVRGVWVVSAERAEEMPAGVPYVLAGSLPYYRALARARWLVNNVNFPDFVVKRPGSVHLQTHHGTPVKVMGVDQAAFPVGAPGLDLHALMRRCDRWDFSLSANPHTTQVWARAYPCRYETLEVGYPRNDRLARAGPAEVARARADLGVHDGRTIILFAPTFREYQSGYSPMLDVEELARSLGPDVLVLVRAHYFYSPRQPRAGPDPAGLGGVRDVSAHGCVEDLLLATDVLITDYSSVMFDFAVLDRPIVIYAPDWDTYRRTRGVTFDLLAEPPGAVASTAADLVDAFRTGAVDDDAAAKARAAFRARFCALEDGHAAERVVRRVFAGQLRAANRTADPTADPIAAPAAAPAAHEGLGWPRRR